MYLLIKVWFRRVFGTLLLVCATLVIFPPIILLGIVWSGKMLFRLSIIWAQVVSWGFGISISLHGGEKIVPGVSYILAPNHSSLLDPLVLGKSLAAGSLFFRWVVKKELLRIPLFGWGLSALGAVGLDRFRRAKAVKLVQRAGDRLKDGWSLLIFPEGTTTRNGKLLPFKKGTFMLAVQTGAPILPITTNGTFKILPRGTLFIRPGHVTVTVGDPIHTSGLNKEDIPALMKKTSDAIQQHLDSKYDPFQRGLARPMKGQV